MRYCPYCGASLMGGAVSFCAECGKHLPTRDIPHKTSRKENKKPNGSIKAKPQAKSSNPQMKSAPTHPAKKRRKNPLDINYDGYYNDVQPIDAGQIGERLDPELIKHIVLLVAGAVGVIILSAILMTML